MTMPQDQHGILLVNLGSPGDCNVSSIRAFLGNFLSDPDVINLPTPFRQILAKGIIAPLRSKKILPKYASIWEEAGSPLHIYTNHIKTALEKVLGENFHIQSAMRYEQPSLESACAAFDQANIKTFSVIPLFPQYARETTGTIIRRLHKIRSRHYQALPEPKILLDFFNAPYFIEALANDYKTKLETFKPDVILWSYHGLPIKSLAPRCSKSCKEGAWQSICVAKDAYLAGDHTCYRSQCYATSRALEQALALPNMYCQTVFQSRIGPLKWVGPALIDRMHQLREQGYKRLAIACPSFVTDCLETLEEINIVAREDWLKQDGEDFLYLPCVNAQTQFVEGLANYAKQLTIELNT